MYETDESNCLGISLLAYDAMASLRLGTFSTGWEPKRKNTSRDNFREAYMENVCLGGKICSLIFFPKMELVFGLSLIV